jgi:hypothetical protein
VKKIYADLRRKINISRSSALSAQKLWSCRPENQVTVPKHAEGTKRTGSRLLIEVFEDGSFHLIVARRNGFFFQRVFATPDTEVRRCFFLEGTAKMGNHGCGGRRADRTSQALRHDAVSNFCVVERTISVGEDTVYRVLPRHILRGNPLRRLLASQFAPPRICLDGDQAGGRHGDQAAERIVLLSLAAMRKRRSAPCPLPAQPHAIPALSALRSANKLVFGAGADPAAKQWSRNLFVDIIRKATFRPPDRPMVDVLNFYLDESGVRHPQRRPGTRAAHGYDWFALGGVLVNEEDESEVRRLHSDFSSRWNVRTALHSSEIRSQREQFRWLRSLSEPDRCDFYESLYVLMRDAPLTGLACVVDRPGYNSRYLALYQQQPWLLCKTAFSIVVERAAKYARNLGRRLRVAPERCNSAEDDLLKSYYNSLKINGLPFAVESSEKYSPFTAEQFRETLYEFRLKGKSSPMAQLADLYLWPMCMGGYHESNQPYARLIRDGKLIECLLSSDAWPTLGTKYSCFDLVERKP